MDLHLLTHFLDCATIGLIFSLFSPQMINLSVNWFVFHADSGVLILSSGKTGNMLHPFQFKQQSVIKLPKFEVELSPGKGTGQPTLQVSICVTQRVWFRMTDAKRKSC